MLILILELESMLYPPMTLATSDKKTSLFKANLDVTSEWIIWEGCSGFKLEAEESQNVTDVCAIEKKFPIWTSERINLLLNIQGEKFMSWEKQAYCPLRISHSLRNVWQHNIIIFSLLLVAMWACGYHCRPSDVLQIFLSLAKPQIQFVPS